MIGFLGPAGTFTEQAAHCAFPTADATSFCPMPSIPAVLDAVANGEVRSGVVPMENSIQGTVHVTIDGLLARPRLEITREILLRIEQHLMVLEGGNGEQIEEVWSHPQALAQCRSFIRDRKLREVQFDSTAAAAAALASSNRQDVAAIGPQQAAVEHGLAVIENNIADVTENWTRFAVVRSVGTGEVNTLVGDGFDEIEEKKTMLVVTPYQNIPGVLASVLNVFSALGLNLSWIESRPTRQRLGTYQFFVEIQAGIETESLKRSISVIEAYGHKVHILGSYQSASVQGR